MGRSSYAFREASVVSRRSHALLAKGVGGWECFGSQCGRAQAGEQSYTHKYEARCGVGRCCHRSGWCFETSKATTHALNNATLGGLLVIADKGWKQALADDRHLLEGLNVAQGKVTYEAVASDLGYDYVPAASMI